MRDLADLTAALGLDDGPGPVVTLAHDWGGLISSGWALEHPGVHAGTVLTNTAVHHDGAGVFAGLPRPFEATRYHSLVVDPATLPDVLEVTAWTDPEAGAGRVIMGLRHREHDVEGVQFHPESILTGTGHQILQRFLDRVSPVATTLGRRTRP